MSKRLYKILNNWISFDIDCIDAVFVPGIGWLKSGGLLLREVLYLLKKIVQNTVLYGIKVVKVSSPDDSSEMTSPMATRVIYDKIIHLVGRDIYFL